MVCLRPALNISRSSILRRVTGREFQSRGATVENARSPHVFRRVLGTRRLSPVVRKPGRILRSSMRDDNPGDWLCKALKVNRRTLNCILFRTGSQWSSVNMGVIWSNVFFFISNRAAAFWTASSRFRDEDGRPARILLQNSSREVMREWIRISVAAWVRKGLMAATLRSWKYAVWQIWEMCLSIFIDLSKKTPRFRALSLGETVSLPTVISIDAIVFLIWGEEISIYIRSSFHLVLQSFSPSRPEFPLWHHSWLRLHPPQHLSPYGQTGCTAGSHQRKNERQCHVFVL